MSSEAQVRSSQEIVEEARATLARRAAIVRSANEVTAEIMDEISPEEHQRLLDESYYELYFNTPALRLLHSTEGWAKKCFEAFDFTHEGFLAAAKADIAEAYGFLGQDIEALRVIETIDDPPTGLKVLGPDEPATEFGVVYRLGRGESSQKALALAKLGRVANRRLVKRARTIAQAKDASWSYDYFIKIAYFGDDDVSADIAYGMLAARRSNDQYYSQYNVHNLIKVAAVGHRPALLDAKQGLITINRSDDKNYETWLKAVASVAYIEMEQGAEHIPVRQATYDLPADWQVVEDAWTEIVVANKEAILAEFARGIDITPRDDFTGKIFDDYRMREIIPYSNLKTDSDFRNYINRTLAEYTAILVNQKMENLDELEAKAQDTRECQLSHREAKRRVIQWREANKHFWERIPRIDYKSDDEEAALYPEFLNRNLIPIKKLCLVRAACVAAVRLARAEA